MSNYDQVEITKELQDLWALLKVASAQITVANTPLVRTKLIDGDTTIPAAAANGSEGLPYASRTALMTAIGNNKSVADANQTYLGLISPASTVAYTEATVTIPAYRNIELSLMSGGFSGGGPSLNGSYLWDNRAIAGGVFAGAIASLSIHNDAMTGGIVYKDDAGAPLSELVISNDEASVPMVAVNIDSTLGTKLPAIALLNASVTGNITSTANATGAIVSITNGGTNGSITANAGTFLNCSFNGGAGNVLTFQSGATATFLGCSFSGGSINVGATGVIAMDLQSWTSFHASGGTSTGVVQVIEGNWVSMTNVTTIGTQTNPASVFVAAQMLTPRFSGLFAVDIDIAWSDDTTADAVTFTVISDTSAAGQLTGANNVAHGVFGVAAATAPATASDSKTVDTNGGASIQYNSAAWSTAPQTQKIQTFATLAGLLTAQATGAQNFSYHAIIQNAVGTVKTPFPLNQTVAVGVKISATHVIKIASLNMTMREIPIG